MFIVILFSFIHDQKLFCFQFSNLIEYRILSNNIITFKDLVLDIYFAFKIFNNFHSKNVKIM